MKNKRGFTLVELLAVIVILAVILIIAIPQIMNTIKTTRLKAIEDSARLIATNADKDYLAQQAINSNYNVTSIPCSDVAKLSKDYASCTIRYNDSGVATVRLKGADGGKFSGITCTGTKESITCGESIEEGWIYAFGSITQPSEGEIDYTQVKSDNNNTANVFIRYPETGPYTNSTPKSVCTLYKGSMHCFEATSSSFESNSSTLQALFTPERCTIRTDYIFCRDADWSCTVDANGDIVYCFDPDGIRCIVDNIHSSCGIPGVT